jgi:hypothetical protein
VSRWAIRIAITIFAVGAAAGAADGGPSIGAGGRCNRVLPTTPLGLPGPVIVTTTCGRFWLKQGEVAAYLGPRTLPVPGVAMGYWGDLTWYGFRRGHLLIGRGHRQLWRSHRRYSATNPVNIGAVVLGARQLAFTYYAGRRPLLYLARYGAGERAVVRAETPLTFLGHGDLVTWRDRSRALVLRAAGGPLERVLVPHASDVSIEKRAGRLVFRAGDRLGVMEAGRVHDLGSLRGLGIKGWPAIEPLGELVAVRDRMRLVVLDHDGGVVASSPLPSRQQPADGVSSTVAANAKGTVFAFTATAGSTADGSSGSETIYLLAAGDTQARPLFTTPLDFAVCGRMVELLWHGGWLLYSATEGRAVIVDSSMTATPIDLSGVIARLPGARSDGEGYFDVAWG